MLTNMTLEPAIRFCTFYYIIFNARVFSRVTLVPAAHVCIRLRDLQGLCYQHGDTSTAARCAAQQTCAHEANESLNILFTANAFAVQAMQANM